MIRVVMLPLDMRQRKNQAKMAELGPEIKSLQKRYKNNPQKLQFKQKELYRKAGYRPMMGCLPMLLQLPIFFAFFGAMRALASEQTVGLILNAAQHGVDTVTLPQFLWVHNFWQPDSGLAHILPDSMEFMSFLQTNANMISPETLSLLRSFGLLDYSGQVMQVPEAAYNTIRQGILESAGLENYNNGWFILPALAGLGMFLQQKFSPQGQGGANPMMPVPAQPAADTPEAQQAQGCSNKVMLWVMPIFSIYICLQPTSNAAFALYWFTSSMYAFLQLRIINLINRIKPKGNEIIVTNQ